mmetsp:Transcript_56616/g.166217  ORF Transcript_56616/g.166217 Transcript_56616/m.166217 type:complete len:398 (-) Transcript_56616:825-2018(-)
MAAHPTYNCGAARPSCAHVPGRASLCTAAFPGGLVGRLGRKRPSDEVGEAHDVLRRRRVVVEAGLGRRAGREEEAFAGRAIDAGALLDQIPVLLLGEPPAQEHGSSLGAGHAAQRRARPEVVPGRLGRAVRRGVQQLRVHVPRQGPRATVLRAGQRRGQGHCGMNERVLDAVAVAPQRRRREHGPEAEAWRWWRCRQHYAARVAQRRGAGRHRATAAHRRRARSPRGDGRQHPSRSGGHGHVVEVHRLHSAAGRALAQAVRASWLRGRQSRGPRSRRRGLRVRAVPLRPGPGTPGRHRGRQRHVIGLLRREQLLDLRLGPLRLLQRLQLLLRLLQVLRLAGHHDVAVAAQLHRADVAQALVLQQLGELGVPERRLAELHVEARPEYSLDVRERNGAG